MSFLSSSLGCFIISGSKWFKKISSVLITESLVSFIEASTFATPIRILEVILDKKLLKIDSFTNSLQNWLRLLSLYFID